MYNEDVKNSYVKKLKYKVDTKEMMDVLTLFQKSSILEEKYNCDLAYFNREQLIELIKMFNFTSIYRVREIQRRINRYVVYCSEEYDKSIKKTTISQDKIREIANSGNSKLAVISKEMFEMLVDKMLKNHNAQGAFALVAAWSGLSGYGLSEITLVKLSNIDFSNKKLKIYEYDPVNDKIIFTRTTVVSDLFIKVAELADKEIEYIDNIGRAIGIYENSEYVIKTRITSRNLDTSETKDLRLFIERRRKNIQDRLMRLRNSDDFYFPNLNFESIRRSGIASVTIDVANALGVPLSKLEEDDSNFVIKPILDKFNIDMTYMRSIISTHILKYSQ